MLESFPGTQKDSSEKAGGTWIRPVEFIVLYQC